MTSTTCLILASDPSGNYYWPDLTKVTGAARAALQSESGGRNRIGLFLRRQLRL